MNPALRPTPTETPIVTQAAPRRLLVILPALNEEATIASVIARIPQAIPGIDRVEVLVVDDGSGDRTAEMARAAGASVISHGKNIGVGVAIQTGLDEAIRRRVDFAVNIDADGQFDPEDIPRLLEPVAAGRADFATASRFLDPKLVPQMPWLKLAGNRAMARMVSTIVGQRFHDVSCGFRAYSRETMLQLMLAGVFTYTQETFLLLGQKGRRMVEVPMPVRGVREHGKSRVASNLVRYGIRTSGIIFSSIRDYSPALFFNGAALALLLPSVALAAFFVWHRFTAGTFTPHLWAGFLSAFLFGLAAMVFGLSQIAQMVARIRKVQERELYILRRYLEGGDDRT